MRVTAFTLALLLSGTAIAQTTTTTEPTTGTNTGTMTSSDVSAQTDDTADASTDTTTTTDTGAMSTTTTDTGTMSSSTTGTMSSGTMSGSTGMQTAMGPASGQVVEAGNSNPERDARGILVRSAPAYVPVGWNGMPGPAVGGPVVNATGDVVGSDETYPACSRTVTDNCVQTYERGRSR
jgi:hypothetical protein